MYGNVKKDMEKHAAGSRTTEDLRRVLTGGPLWLNSVELIANRFF